MNIDYKNNQIFLTFSRVSEQFYQEDTANQSTLDNNLLNHRQYLLSIFSPTLQKLQTIGTNFGDIYKDTIKFQIHENLKLVVQFFKYKLIESNRSQQVLILLFDIYKLYSIQDEKISLILLKLIYQIFSNFHIIENIVFEILDYIYSLDKFFLDQKKLIYKITIIVIDNFPNIFKNNLLINNIIRVIYRYLYSECHFIQILSRIYCKSHKYIENPHFYFTKEIVINHLNEGNFWKKEIIYEFILNILLYAEHEKKLHIINEEIVYSLVRDQESDGTLNKIINNIIEIIRNLPKDDLIDQNLKKIIKYQITEEDKDDIFIATLNISSDVDFSLQNRSKYKKCSNSTNERRINKKEKKNNYFN